MISGSADERTLHLWNMSTYHCHKVIRRVGCCWINSIYQFDNDRWIVGGIDSFCILRSIEGLSNPIASVSTE